MSNANQTAPPLGTQPDSGALTSTATITWQKVPCVDVVAVHANNAAPNAVLFANLDNCKKRLNGRALGKISNLSLSIFTDPEYAVTAAVCAVPTNAGASNAPQTLSDLLACGGIILRASPTINNITGSPIFLPGVSALLKGENTTLLAGSPPTLYFIAKAAKMSDWSLPAYKAASTGTTATGTVVYFRISYDLELSGYDWLKPF